MTELTIIRRAITTLRPRASGLRKGKTGRFRDSQPFALSVMSLALLALWVFASSVLNVATYLLPKPLAVLEAFRTHGGLLLTESIVTLREVLVGFVLAVLTAIPLAILMEYSRTLERYAYPLIVITQAVPKVAVAPLFLVWFGFGELPKMLIAALIAFFPLVVSASVGFKSIDPEMLSLAKSMGGSEVKTFIKIRLPWAMPNIFGGLKLAITFAVIGAIVGEFVGGDAGLGYLVARASGTQMLDLLFASLILLSAISVALYYLVEFVERVLVPWADKSDGAGLP